MTTGPIWWLQIWAIIRRYFSVLIRRYPIKTLLRVLIWPGTLLGLSYYLLSNHPANLGVNVYLDAVPFMLMWTTISSVFSDVGTIVKDKSSGMKSLMISMGLKRINYYIALSCCFLTFILPVVWAIGILSKLYIFGDMYSYVTTLVVFTLFAFQLDALVAVNVSFVTSSSYTFVFPLVIFLFESFLLDLSKYLIGLAGNDWKKLILLLVSFSPYQSIRQFCSNIKDQTDQGVVYQQPLYLVITAQLFWIVAFRLFAYWFEEVCPWQNVTAVQNCCFCLRGKSNQYAGDNIEEVATSNSKYFERRQVAESDAGIKINHVTKLYNNRAAVSDVSFTIYNGETTLLLGHNGAGKTTLMNIILGLLEPNSGRVKFKNRSNTLSSSIGVCPQTSILDNDMTVKQHLELFNDIKSDISGTERERHIEQTIVDISLAGNESKRPEELSGGMKRKLSLGIAFVGKSNILILDEPSSGLDPESRVFVWNAIRQYRSERTVLLSTQHMEEADYLGDRIAIMSGGRIVCCGSSIYLNKLFGTGYKLRIECRLSKKKLILDHIKKNYFDALHLTEDHANSTNSRTNSDPIVDFVVELKTNAKDQEVELIRLLEDFENNSENLSIRSYGLKSSSIEDVMLNTSKHFAVDSDEHERLQETSTIERIASLVETQSKCEVSALSLIYALVIKHLQVYQANWFFVLFVKVALPCIEAYAKMHSLNKKVDEHFPWQDPGLILMTAHLVYFPVHERAFKFKTVQLDSNVSVWIYWLAQAVVDIISVLIGVAFMIVFASMYADVLVSNWQFYSVITLITLTFYLASMLFCYCLSTIISDAKSSIGYIMVLSFFSLAVNFVIYMFRVALLNGGYESIQTVISHMGMFIFPTDAFAYALRGLQLDCLVSSNTICIPRPGISLITESLIAMCFQTIVYTSFLTLIELQMIDIEWYSNWRNICCCFRPQAKFFPGENREIDRDVVEETTKALSAINDPGSHALVATQLNKSYIKNTKVIKNLSFSVNKGECFGLLGVNGAGKTTTFTMLAAESTPESGRIMAVGNYLDVNIHKYRKNIGYDPQATPELSMTPYQSLQLMARLRGVDEQKIPTLINSVLSLLDMVQHTYKSDKHLSGGTKRKLALGMALIGNPKILALDEPTAGVDPMARRGIWHLLKSLRTRNEASIIISSHAMEECEAICDRITIMARGHLRCIGTFLHLRSKFAKGCTLRVQFASVSPKKSDSVRTKLACQDRTDPFIASNSTSDHHSMVSLVNRQTNRRSSFSLVATDKIVEELQQKLSACIGPGVFRMADRNVNSVTFSITDNRVRRSILFQLMRDFRQSHPSVNYMINDDSLEDIFISLAHEQH